MILKRSPVVLICQQDIRYFLKNFLGLGFRETARAGANVSASAISGTEFSDIHPAGSVKNTVSDTDDHPVPIG